MPLITFKQKILLVFWGIIATFILLEVFLRIGGFIFTLNQERYNRVIQERNESEFRILCLGESTTAIGGRDSYPYQLEEILNEQNLGKKFEVINKGAVSKKTDFILKYLKKNLDEYSPDVVVLMLGINDILAARTHIWWGRLRDVLEHSRSYKLVEYAIMHLFHKLNLVSPDEPVGESPLMGQQKISPEDDLAGNAPGNITLEDPQVMEKLWQKSQLAFQSAQQQLQGQGSLEAKNRLEKLKLRQTLLSTYIGRYYRIRKQYEEAKQYLEVSLKLDKDNYSAYIELVRCYREEGECQKAIDLTYQALELKPEKRGLALAELARCYDKLGMTKETRQAYLDILEEGTEFFWLYHEMGNWFKDHAFYEDAQSAYLRALGGDSRDGYLFEKLAFVYEKLNQLEKSLIYQKKYRQWQEKMQTYPPFTVRNYQDIVDIISSRGIKVICVQYPRRSIEPLKHMLGSSRQVIFVENKENFSKALAGSEYTRYFSDSFAGDFGHCTREGNHLIAQNLAEAIIRELF